MNNIKENALMEQKSLPNFTKIKEEHMFSAIKYLVNENKKLIKEIEKKDRLTWGNFIHKLEESDDKISKAWAPIRHLNSVMNSPKIRKQYEKSLNLLTLHYGKVGQNRKLFTKYEDFYSSQKNNLSAGKLQLIMAAF